MGVEGRRSMFKMNLKKASSDSEKRFVAYSRQVEYRDPFEGYYTDTMKIVEPPYDIAKLYELVEDCGILGSCVEAYVINICGFGNMITPIKGTDYDLSDEEKKQKEFLEEIFRMSNPFESFSTIQKNVLMDREICGNGYIEVIRDMAGRPTMMFHMDAKRVRIVKTDDKPIEIKAKIVRNGKLIDVAVMKTFKRYVMLNGDGTLRYFKEYGDPRLIDAETGEEVTNESEAKDIIPASEVLHFKIGTGIYGVPRWAKVIKTVLGIIMAEFINYDLFDSQGIPPMMIMVEGGELTEESLQELYDLVSNAKGFRNFNKIALLEALSTTTTLDGKESIPRIKFVDLASYRSEDILFENYLDRSEKHIRKAGFRLPEIFVGATENLNYSTAKISRETAEEQIFIPERTAFDEIINNTIVKDLGITSLAFKTLGPVIKSAEDVIKILPQLIKSGPFSLNDLITYANKNFGFNLEHYDEDWADLPLPLLINLFQSIGMAVGSLISKEGVDSLPPNALGGIRSAIEVANQWTRDITDMREPGNEE